MKNAKSVSFDVQRLYTYDEKQYNYKLGIKENVKIRYKIY